MNLILIRRQKRKKEKIGNDFFQLIEMSLESSHDLFFTTIIESAKEIILDSKKLINLITNTTDDLENEEIANGVADQSVETEARTVKLVEHVVKFVEKNSAEAGAKVHCEFLLDATKAVKNSILELIRASKVSRKRQ